MGCIIELRESLLRLEFNGKRERQTLLVDVLLKYGEYDINRLALALDTSVEELQKILDGKHFFVGEMANNLSHLFLTFFGQTFFNNVTLIRDFRDELNTMHHT